MEIGRPAMKAVAFDGDNGAQLDGLAVRCRQRMGAICRLSIKGALWIPPNIRMSRRSQICAGNEIPVGRIGSVERNP